MSSDFLFPYENPSPTTSLLEDRDAVRTTFRSKVRDDLGPVTEYRVLHVSIGERVDIDASTHRIDRHCTLLTSVITRTA